MLFKTSTAELIDKLVSENSTREEKIEESISLISDKITEIHKYNAELMDKYVSLELEGNTEELEEIDKQLNENRIQIENLTGKKEAYERLIIEDKHVKNAIPKILESARKDRAERNEKIKKKQSERETLNLKIKDLENKIAVVDAELSSLQFNDEAVLIKPLLKYIEPRKIKHNFEDPYIHVLLDGSPREYLEQYIEQ